MLASPPSRRMSLLTSKEGLRTPVPEGGELVCYRNEEDQQLCLKVEYSREMLSSSIFCHQRPTGLKTVAEEMPELLGLPQPIPLTSDITSLDSSVHHPCRIYTAVRGPVMEANETNRMLSNHRDLQKRLLNMSLQGEPGYFIDCFETPAAREIRNPQFT